ncbi:MAG: hypothetical protein WBG57_13120 [Ornithinimicrobium sp.]
MDNVFTVMWRKSLPPAALAGALTAVVLGLVDGLGAAVSGLVGVFIALSFFVVALVVMSRLVTGRDPMVFMAVGMSVYFGQVLVLLGVLIVARGIEALDMRAAGIAMLVAVVVWQIAQMRAWRSARVLVYDEDTSQSQGRPGVG